MILLNTTAGSSRWFHDEVINSDFGELIYLCFSFMWFLMGEEEIPEPVQSLALSCSWHTLAEDMSAEKYEPIHTALHAPTLKCYKGTFKWKTSNKLQLRCSWQIALPWVPHHCSPCSSTCCFSQGEKWEPALVFLCPTDRSCEGEQPQAPMVGSLQGWDDIPGKDTGLSISPVKSLQLFPHWPDPGVCSNSSRSLLPQKYGICCPIPWWGSQMLCTLFSPAPTPVPCPVRAPSSRKITSNHSELLQHLSHLSTDSGLTTPHLDWAGLCPLPVLSPDWQRGASKGLLTGFCGMCKAGRWDSTVYRICWTWVVQPLRHCLWALGAPPAGIQLRRAHFPSPLWSVGSRQEQLPWHSSAELGLVSLHTSHPDSLSLVFSAAIWCFCFLSHPDKSRDFRFCIWGYSR